MAGLPRFLLRHQVTVSPYRSWGVWGAPTVLRVAAQRLPDTGGAPGTLRIAVWRLIAPVDTAAPAGSRITLPDGTAGWVVESLTHASGGLPTPDHVAVTAHAATVTGPAAGETVTILRATASGRRDAHGTDLPTITPIPVPGCAVGQYSGSEDATGGGSHTVDRVTIIAPPGTVVAASERLLVRGLPHDVDGTPVVLDDPQAGMSAGVRIVAVRVTG